MHIANHHFEDGDAISLFISPSLSIFFSAVMYVKLISFNTKINYLAIFAFKIGDPLAAPAVSRLLPIG